MPEYGPPMEDVGGKMKFVQKEHPGIEKPRVIALGSEFNLTPDFTRVGTGNEPEATRIWYENIQIPEVGIAKMIVTRRTAFTDNIEDEGNFLTPAGEISVPIQYTIDQNNSRREPYMLPPEIWAQVNANSSEMADKIQLYMNYQSELRGNSQFVAVKGDQLLSEEPGDKVLVELDEWIPVSSSGQPNDQQDAYRIYFPEDSEEFKKIKFKFVLGE